jgi:LIVCS family branched-chain amino acid:cation transporter
MAIYTKGIVAGFAIFSMIFGAGNIVFPLIIGKDFASMVWIAIAGWLITTVILPLGGYFGALLFQGDTRVYLRPVGKTLTSVFLTLIMIMAGPLGVVARGVNIAFGGFNIVAPAVAESLFNLLFCLVTVCLAWNPGKLVQVIGLVFTPLKFGGVVLVVIGALIMGGSFSNLPHCPAPPLKCFTESLMMGYQTMDLLAAFLMASTVFLYMKNALPAEIFSNKGKMIKAYSIACCVGGILFTITYIGLTLIGAQYSEVLKGVSNESLFAKIAGLAMGDYASVFVAIVIAACCLGTNVGLTSVFTDFVHSDVLKERFNRKYVLLASGVLTFVVSLLGFSKICGILGVVLNFIYPFMILFVILRVTYYFVKKMHKD